MQSYQSFCFGIRYFDGSRLRLKATMDRRFPFGERWRQETGNAAWEFGDLPTFEQQNAGAS